WLFVEAIYARKITFRLAFAALAGLAAAVFNLAWGGWWFIFAFILTASAATIAAGFLHQVAMALIERKPLNFVKITRHMVFGSVGKHFTIPAMIFFAATGLFISLFNGLDRFLLTPQLVFGVSTLKTPVLGDSFWPNVLTTVAELNPGSFQQLVSQIKPGIFWLAASSGAMLLLIAVLNFGLLKKYLKMINPKEEKALYAIFFAALLAIWYIGTIYSATKGVRFVLLITPMVGLGFGMALGLIYKFTMWINENYLKINSLAVAAIIFGILATATYSTDLTKNAYNMARHDVPIMNDAWYNSLTAIREDSNSSTKDAIITSWWDFGHHFKSVADRRVTFDGTTQQGPQAHWVGKFFMTKNETEAAGILRMLDCGSGLAFDKLFEISQDFTSSITMLNRLTQTPSKADAKKTLTQEYRLTSEQAENVLQYTHCEHPPEGYVIASEDMIGKSGVWSHFGSWNFERGIIWQTLRNKNEIEAVEAMKKMFNYTDEKAKSTYTEMKKIKSDPDANSWIAPWPSFSGDITGCGVISSQNDTDKIVRCGTGLVVNLTTHDAFFPLEDGSSLHPASLVYISNETGTEDVVEKVYNESVVPQRLSVILVPQGDGFISIVASPEDAAGMFTRMYFMGGIGLKHFKLLTHQTGLTGTNVYVYKADWDSLK
ncbi:MAG TPA: STT3 domain-containing protein, partial [Candidatus Nanoarchaeia archaeon]|nr:STT3 domain-containing protein [Candidatus Nanoarchaeia archaeon]